MKGYWFIPARISGRSLGRQRIETDTNQLEMEQSHMSLAEKISQGILLDALPYVDKEV